MYHQKNTASRLDDLKNRGVVQLEWWLYGIGEVGEGGLIKRVGEEEGLMTNK